MKNTFRVGLLLLAVQTLLFTGLFIGGGSVARISIDPLLAYYSLGWALLGTAILSGCSLADASDIVKTLFLTTSTSIALTAVMLVTVLSSVSTVPGEWVFVLFVLTGPLIVILSVVGGLFGGFMGSWMKNDHVDMYKVFLFSLRLTILVAGGLFMVVAASRL